MSDLRTRLFQTTKGRCQECNRAISLEAIDHTAAYVVHREILCVYCRATVKNNVIGAASIAGCRPETVAEIATGIIAGCQEEGVPPPSPALWPNYVMLPQEQIITVIERTVAESVKRAARIPKNRRDHPKHKRKEDKLKLGAKQNNQCAYCGVTMHYDTVIDSAEKRMTVATWEHVVDLNHGGDWSHQNLILTCWFCNMLKNDMKMADNEFVVWLYGNRDQYEAMRAKMVERLNEKNKTKIQQMKVKGRLDQNGF